MANVKFKILDYCKVGTKFSIMIEGNGEGLKNNDIMTDEKGNNIVIESIGMTHFSDPDNRDKFTSLLVSCNSDNLGLNLMKD